MCPAASPVVLTVSEKMFIAKVRSYGLLSVDDAKILHEACIEYGRGTKIQFAQSLYSWIFQLFQPIILCTFVAFSFLVGLGLYRSGQSPKLEDTIRNCTAVLRDFGYYIVKVHGEETAKPYVAHVRKIQRPWDEDMYDFSFPIYATFSGPKSEYLYLISECYWCPSSFSS